MALLDVYEAVEPGPLFAMHHTTPDQGCVVGHGIQPAMQSIYEGIEETVGTSWPASRLRTYSGTYSQHLARACPAESLSAAGEPGQ